MGWSASDPAVATIPHILLLRSRQERRIAGGGPALCKHPQTTEAGGECSISHHHHPVARLRCAGLPDPGVQGSTHHAEAQRVGCSPTGRKGGCPNSSDRPADFLLHYQLRAVYRGFVPVISIAPAQYRPQVRTGKAADRTAEEYFGICGSRAEYCVVGTSPVRDLPGIAGNREDALFVGIASPGLSIGGRSPQRPVPALPQSKFARYTRPSRD